MRRRSLALWAFMLAVGYALSSLVPPLQSPDEHSHLVRAYIISKGELGLQNPEGGSSGGMAAQALLDFSDAYLSTVAARADARLTSQQRIQAESLRWGQQERFFPVPGTGYYLPLIYAPHTLAMLAGQSLDLTVANSYRLARLMTLGLCLGLLVAAFRILEPPVLSVALLLLPMTLFQLLSPTLDGLTTCLAVLALSVFLRAQRDGAHTAARSWTLAFSVLLLATSRIQLLPLIALPFFVAWRRQSARDAWLGTAALVLALAWIVYALATTVDVRVVRSHSTAELLVHYATDPTAFVKVVYGSVTNPELWRFYTDSFVGILGWLDTRLPALSYTLLWAALGVCAAITVAMASWTTNLSARLLLLAAALVSAALVFLALLVTWTPHPAATVSGVQGRYFVVPALMVAYALGGVPVANGPQRPRVLVLGMFAALALSALITTVLARYH